MTEENKALLPFLLRVKGECKIKTALEWAKVYQLSPVPYLSPYMIACLVYFHQTGTGRINSIGRAFCDTIFIFSIEEAEKLLSNYQFPSDLIYKVMKEWMKRNEVPSLFKVSLLNCRYEILHAASNKDDAEMVRWLLRNDVNADKLDSSGKSALHIAAAGGKVRTIRLLVNAGASISLLDCDMQLPIEVALKNGCYHAARLLGPKQLCNKILDGKQTLLMKLISEECEPQVRFMIPYANFSVRLQSEENLLHVAARTGNIEIMKLLLEQEMASEIINTYNSLGQSPLYLAVLYNKADLVEQLLAVGAAITDQIKALSPVQEIVNLIRIYDPATANLCQFLK